MFLCVGLVVLWGGAMIHYVIGLGADRLSGRAS